MDSADSADAVAGDPAMAAALRRAEQFRVVTDAAPLLLSYVDAADLRYRFVNQTYELWFGHPRAQLEGRTMEEVLGPAAFALLGPYVEAALAGQKVTFEQEVPYKDGGLRRIHATYVPDRDEQGTVQGFVVVVADITERKHGEEALRASEARTRAIVDTALDCIIAMDQEGRILEWNPAAEQVFGRQREEALGQELAALIIPPALRAAHRQGLMRYLETGEGPLIGGRYEVPALRRDGSEFPAEVSITRVPGDGPPTFTGFVRDLSERKRAEDDLRLVTAGARCLLWHALVEDTGGDTLRWDITVPDEQAAQQFLPLTVPPGRSYTDAFYESRLPEDRVRTDADAVQCMRACQQGYSQEFRCQDKDGRVRWLKEDARVTSLGAGRWRAVGVCTDVTELKRAEEEKARLLDQVRAAAQQQRAFLRDVLASVTQGRLRLVDRIEELPPRREPVGGEPVALSAASLRALRHRVAQAAAALGFDKDTGNDLVTAVGEAAMNVVAHAKEGVGSVGVEATTGTVQVWIEDKGGGIDLSHLPRATLERGFSVGTTPGIGHGFWLMLQTAHRVWLLTGSAGTMVVLEQDRTAPEPGWLAQA